MPCVSRYLAARHRQVRCNVSRDKGRPSPDIRTIDIDAAAGGHRPLIDPICDGVRMLGHSVGMRGNCHRMCVRINLVRVTHAVYVRIGVPMGGTCVGVIAYRAARRARPADPVAMFAGPSGCSGSGAAGLIGVWLGGASGGNYRLVSARAAGARRSSALAGCRAASGSRPGRVSAKWFADKGELEALYAR